MTEQLKPCPHCGDEAVAKIGKPKAKAGCKRCVAEIAIPYAGDGLDELRQCIAAWNRRAEVPS